jgi:8-oxo-dGTP pyrophosphatase MutT (NUDIX family)
LGPGAREGLCGWDGSGPFVEPRRASFRTDRPAVAELAAGAVVEAPDGSVLLLHHSGQSRWCFPKGHVDTGETVEKAALREIGEEAGLASVTLGPELATITYRYFDEARDVSVVKTSLYFRATSAKGPVRLEATFDSHAWLSLEEAEDRLSYEDERSVVRSMRALRPA